MAVRNMTQEEKITYMTTKHVPSLICELAVPTIISMLVTAFYNMADTFFVGKLNTQATAAVGIVFTVMALIQAFGFFLRTGKRELYFQKTRCQGIRRCGRYGIHRFFYGDYHWYRDSRCRTYLFGADIVVSGFHTDYFALYKGLS